MLTRAQVEDYGRNLRAAQFHTTATFLLAHDAEQRATIEAQAQRIAELEAEVHTWRRGGMTEELLRRQDGFLKVGKGCVLIREDDYAELKAALKRQQEEPQCLPPLVVAIALP